MNLPSGTITFLFTDIEGSTKMWERHPAQMGQALAHHDEILRQTIEANDGYVFKTVGDAFCAAFHTAPQAVRAAFEAQTVIEAEPLRESPILKVRMAVHTGAAEVRDNDYFGQPLNRAARLLSAAHGSQVILSDVSHDLCRDALPAGCTLRALGEHRLKDLGRPESVFQLCHPSLRADFPALKSIENLPNNLPQQLTTFVGRDAEAANLRDLVLKSRLVTLTGSGGCGKTRLSLQVAADVLDRFPDGAWFVELAPIADPQLVVRAIAAVLGLKDEPGTPPMQKLKEYAREKRLLLILDNCEHLLDACARVTDEILRHCPGVAVLASSREGLGIGGELTYRVPSLSLPSQEQKQSPESLAPYGAVQLFIDRAQLHNPAFEVTTQNAAAVASVCHRLDGIPLAIELAAARLKSMSVEEVNQRLDHRFRLLTGGSRTALPRQQTLRSLIDWSYDLLTGAERALLCRLSVFSGGWMLEAAEAVCAGEPLEDWEILDHLSSLTDKSLVTAEECQGATRYRLLETVRQYARDRMMEAGQAEKWRDAHFAYYSSLVIDAEQRFARDTLATFGIVVQDYANIRAALSWSLEGAENLGAGMRTATKMQWFWYVRGHYSEARQWYDRFLAADLSAVEPETRARILCSAGILAGEAAYYSTAMRWLEEALAIARENALEGATTRALHGIGLVALDRADFGLGQAVFEEGLSIYRRNGTQGQVTTALMNLAEIRLGLGEFRDAEELFKEGLGMFRTLGRPRGVAFALDGLGKIALYEADLKTARELLEQSLTTRREIGDRRATADSLASLGTLLIEEGKDEAAKACFREAQSINLDIGFRRGSAQCLEGLAALSEPLIGAKLWGAASRLREEAGVPHYPVDRTKYEARIAAARLVLDNDGAFDQGWAEGRAMTLEQAVEATAF
jgi:predicted ATPase/class 3 adenylate cyclase